MPCSFGARAYVSSIDIVVDHVIADGIKQIELSVYVLAFHLELCFENQAHALQLSSYELCGIVRHKRR